MASLAEPSRVFFAQTVPDRTLIAGNRFLGSSDALEGLAGLGKDRPLLAKPHPWQPDNPVVETLRAAGGTITEIATCSLLTDPAVDVVTLSSSVGWEALAFGRRSTIISPATQNWIYSGIDVLRHALSPPSWGPLLESAGLTVHEAAREP